MRNSTYIFVLGALALGLAFVPPVGAEGVESATAGKSVFGRHHSMGFPVTNIQRTHRVTPSREEPVVIPGLIVSRPVNTIRMPESPKEEENNNGGHVKWMNIPGAMSIPTAVTKWVEGIRERFDSRKQ